jgi:hypothetical protein
MAWRAAELAESATNDEQFWHAHVTLMSRSETLREDDLRAVAERLDLTRLDANAARMIAERARRRVQADVESARASGVRFTPTVFINGRRYDGPWDERSFTDAMLGSLGHRVRTAALRFASWAPSAGVLLLLASILAVSITNSPFGGVFAKVWQTELGLELGERTFRLSLLHWINDALLTVFFLVVQSHAVRELLSDDGGVHGGTLEHRHHNRGDGATPIGLELLVPRRRSFANGTNEGIAHNEVVLRLRTPSHVLRAEISERILQHRHVFQVSDHERQRGLEMSLERRHVNGKQRSKGGRSREQVHVEAGRQRAGLGGHFAEAAFETCDTFRCHN